MDYFNLCILSFLLSYQLVHSEPRRLQYAWSELPDNDDIQTLDFRLVDRHKDYIEWYTTLS
jgi:hypothetical protein